MLKEKKIGGPYDEDYASRYNDIWLHSDTWAPEARNHIKKLNQLIKPDTLWLDAGCGTGYYLSQFPGVRRAGFDLSEAMLQKANKANPDALFFRQMNLLNDVPEWHNAWNLVTCTGQPYSYLQTLDEIEQTALNLANWTSKDGVCMITPIDIFDMAFTRLPTYYYESEIPNHQPQINAVIWDLKEPEVFHQNMIFPSIDQWVRWMSRYFHKIEVIFWPHDTPHMRLPRRVIICSEKREPGENQPAKVVEQNEFGIKVNTLNYNELTNNERDTFISYVSNKQLLKELAFRLRSGKLLRSLRKKLFS